jgi:hypothetical protein
MGEGRRAKVEAAVTPYLEMDERMKVAFTGQTPIPPLSYVLIIPLLLLPIRKLRTVVVTDRNLYVFSHKGMRSDAFTDKPYKVAIERARLENGASSARVDGGSKLWVMPFGAGKRSLDQLGKAAFESRAVRLRAEVKEARDRGFGTTPM